MAKKRKVNEWKTESAKNRLKRWYLKHKNDLGFMTKYAEQRRKNHREKRTKNIEQAMNLHYNKCRICGNTDKRVLIWHHMDSNKNGRGLRGLAANNVAFWNEVKKCILICANCHMIIHADNNGR